eukprot:CAMPEP_0201283546 /NCGR_PEP_ID=MMETSP1317-20130820/11861_1 /ASSEMBLY_ACC=CAM_ASM_000770 /TAXON_ID=187299 /ORGANISM="Undescribed Undescribed, Strain Undescribed" /LENGTH=32 /DNA_ID= /DNA_START= /DNA_END= /DNA_ORIENTATION=
MVEMGFTDYCYNLALLEAEHGEVERVIEAILD